MRRQLLFLAVAVMVSSCGLTGAQIGGNVTPESLAANGEAALVIGIQTEGMDGICTLGFGEAGSGQNSRFIGLGDVTSNGPPSHASFTAVAGKWELYLIGCGDQFIVETTGETAQGAADRNAPFGEFDTAAGEVVYLGDLIVRTEAPVEGNYAGINILDNADAGRTVLAKSNAKLVPALQTRLLKLAGEQ